MRKLNRLSFIMCLFFLITGCSVLNPEVKMPAGEPTAEIVMDKIQEKMAEEYKQVVHNGIVSDAETHKPLYKLMDLKSSEATEFFPAIEHFNLDEIEGGYILEALDSVTSSELIIVLEMNDAKATDSVYWAMQKLLSDQEKYWSDHITSEYQFVRNNKIVSQGNYFLYVTSEKYPEIVKRFQEEVG